MRHVDAGLGPTSRPKFHRCCLAWTISARYTNAHEDVVAGHWCSRFVSTLGGGTFVAFVACSSSNTATPDAAAFRSASPSGGPVPGPADMHCVVDGKPVVQSTDMASCMAGDLDAGDGVGTAAGDGGPIADGGDCSLGFGYTPTLYGQSGSDDDCKYDVQWTSTPICENQNVYFTVTATRRTDHKPVTGARIVPDVVLDCMYPIWNSQPFRRPRARQEPTRSGPLSSACRAGGPYGFTVL